jgi:hypothetical protein
MDCFAEPVVGLAKDETPAADDDGGGCVVCAKAHAHAALVCSSSRKRASIGCNTVNAERILELSGAAK